MLLGSLFWILLFATLIWLLVRRFGAQGTPPPPFGYRPAAPFPAQPPFQPPFPQPSATEILRQRYARGEIDTATYEQMRERLGGSEPAGE